MKSSNKLMVAILHMVVPTVFLLLQGCASGNKSVVDFLYWPYNTPLDEPERIPEQNFDDSVLLPPVSFPDEPMISTMPVSVTPERPVTAPDQFYTVQKGDTLSGIASRYGTTWKNLAAYNGLNNAHKIFPGQELRIDGSLAPSGPVTRSASPPRSTSPSGGGSSGGAIAQGGAYVIQKGDTLSGIASRSGLSVAEIKAANALTSSAIVAGKSLSIPKSGEVSAPAPVDAPAPMAEPAPELTAETAPIADLAPLAPAASAPVYEHVLYPGETLDDVASQFGSTKEEILQLNDIANPDDIKPGTKLLVPIPE